jgi:hypothetical protein
MGNPAAETLNGAYKQDLSKLIPAYKLTLVPFRMFAVRIVIMRRG